MAVIAKKTSVKKSKKANTDAISAILAGALVMYKKDLGDKKFLKKVKKAAKVFADGLKAAKTTTMPVKKVAAKKPAIKKVIPKK